MVTSTIPPPSFGTTSFGGFVFLTLVSIVAVLLLLGSCAQLVRAVRGRQELKRNPVDGVPVSEWVGTAQE